MIRIWAKIIKENKIKKSLIFENFVLFNRENFEKTIEMLCEKLDQPCPVFLTKHFKYFSDFNITQFTKSDFVENVKFDKLVIENAIS